MKRTASLLLLLLPASLIAQQPQLATIHLYRTGLRGQGVQVVFDDKKVFKIGNHKGVSFQVKPGLHQISARIANEEPTAAIQVLPGKDYYFDFDMEMPGEKRALFTAGLAGTPQLVTNMARLDGPPDDKIEEEKLKPEELASLSESSFHEESPVDTSSLPVEKLTDEEVASAVIQGRHDSDPNNIGLRLNDTATNLLSHAFTPQYAVSGFTVFVFSPSRWVEYQAAVANRELRPFTVADVTPEMRVKALHVIALPSAPENLTGPNMAAASGVLRVTVCDAKCNVVVQPLTEEQGTVELNSALRSMDYTKLASTFNMAEVDSVRHLASATSFYIAVVGENGTRKLFQVNNRLFTWM